MSIFNCLFGPGCIHFVLVLVSSTSVCSFASVCVSAYLSFSNPSLCLHPSLSTLHTLQAPPGRTGAAGATAASPAREAPGSGGDSAAMATTALAPMWRSSTATPTHLVMEVSPSLVTCAVVYRNWILLYEWSNFQSLGVSKILLKSPAIYVVSTPYTPVLGNVMSVTLSLHLHCVCDNAILCVHQSIEW